MKKRMNRRRAIRVMADNYNKGDDEAENMMYMVAYRPGAEEVLQEVYGNDDAAGFFVFKENLSRKADVVPALSAALQQAAQKAS